MNIIPIKDLKNTAKIEELCKSSAEPLFITKNGYGSLVIMDIKHYSNLIDEIEEARQLQKGLDDIANGKLYDSDLVAAELSEKYNV